MSRRGAAKAAVRSVVRENTMLAVVLAFVAGLVTGLLFLSSIGTGSVVGAWDRAVLVPTEIPILTPVASPTPSPPASMTPSQPEQSTVYLPPEMPVGDLSLFILASQSNMSGRGKISGDQTPHPQVFVFGNDYRWKEAAEPLDSEIGAVAFLARSAIVSGQAGTVEACPSTLPRRC